MTLSAEVWQFLSEHGISLSDYGSAEKALSRDQAIRFVRLLQAHGAFPSGIEVWESYGDGWRIDSTGGWFVDDLPPRDTVADAVRFLTRARAAESLLFTVQF